ncbi:MAG: diaminopimelate epimerase, partial [Bacteroidia bacterium]|nr:diaminopimelate epimerase [Bacteroidia bacterium]
TMCGNGGRCISAFAKFLGLVKTSGTFEAIDGLHDFEIDNNHVKLKMQNVDTLDCFDNYTFLDTGSPHYVTLKNKVEELDVKEEGAKIRYSKPFAKQGVNVNFVEKTNYATFKVRTYERGVEDETLSCGTGVTAVAIAMHKTRETKDNLITLQTPGGELQIAFSTNDSGYNNIWLIGPAKQVFKGEVTW